MRVRRGPRGRCRRPCTVGSLRSRLPESLLHYLRTRGTDRILFASDHPVLSMQRCLGEIEKLDLTDEVRDAWQYRNASAFFFGE